jgi:hypothetical protein
MKLLVFAILPLVSFVSPGAAAADMLKDCAKAIEQGDMIAVERLSFAIIGVKPFPVDRMQEARNCFAPINRDDIVYDPGTQQIRFSDALLAQIEDERVRRNETLAALEQAEMDRKHAALLRTIEACRALYGRDWIAAMTSPICQPIFVETGLPD